jgi:hypothetical protein
MKSIVASHLHLLLPFSLPAATGKATDHGCHALPVMPQSALATLLARATLIERTRSEDFQWSLPHECWLARHFNVINEAAKDAPLGAYMLLADGGARNEIGTACWACLEPVHLHIAHDHLLLIDPAQLTLSRDEANALCAAVRPVLESSGMALIAPTPRRWYVSAPALDTLVGASPLAAVGRNIEIWLPHDKHTGERSRSWMKIQNEVQMTWFAHPVNHDKEAQGRLTANSVWLYASGQLKPVPQQFSRVLSNSAATQGLGLASGLARLTEVANPPDAFDLLAGAPGKTLLELDMLTQPFLQQDETAWHAAWTQLERDWFKPAHQALQNGALRTLTLTLCGERGTVTLTTTRTDLWRFWRRGAARALFY